MRKKERNTERRALGSDTMTDNQECENEKLNYNENKSLKRNEKQ